MIGELIKRRRTALNMSQTQLADLMRVSRDAIVRWEKGGTVAPNRQSCLIDWLSVDGETATVYLIERKTDDGVLLQRKFYATQDQAIVALKKRLSEWQEKAPRFAEWFDDGIGITVISAEGVWWQYRIFAFDRHESRQLVESV